MTDQEKIEGKLRLEAQYSNGASWFYWIAGLSLLNTIIGLFNGSLGFISGLGITQIIDASSYILSDVFGNGIIYFGVFIDLLIIGLFFAFGKLSYKKKIWAMIAGGILYTLDILSFIIITDYLSIGFHALAIYSIVRAVQAHYKMKEVENLEQLSFLEDGILSESTNTPTI